MIETIDVCGIRFYKHTEVRLAVINEAVIDEVIRRDTYGLRPLALAEPGFKMIVDIGAHVGTFSALAGQLWPEASIWAFEPGHPYFQMLGLNIPPNGQAINLAVLGYYDRKPPGGRELYPSHSDERYFRSVRKQGISVKQLFAQLDTIDLLKIDCEQSEVEILREMEELNVFDRVKYIRGEWHFDTAKEEVRRILGPRYKLNLVDVNKWNSFSADPL